MQSQCVIVRSSPCQLVRVCSRADVAHGQVRHRLRAQPEDTPASVVQVLLSELSATRKQVDRLLEQQALLLQMLQQQQQQQLQPQLQLNSCLKLEAAPSVEGPGTPSASSSAAAAVKNVGNVLSEIPDFTPAGPASASSLISEAMQRVAQGMDVLQDQHPAPAGAAQAQAVQNQQGSGISQPLELPELRAGQRHAWWLEQLHVALLARGYYAGDADVQNWLFGPGTEDAVRRFQQAEGLPPTGAADSSTWAALLAGLPKMQADLQATFEAGKVPAPPAAPRQEPEQPQAQAQPLPAASSAPQAQQQQQEAGLPRLVLGAEDIQWVSRLHRALITAGFYPPEDECEDWLFLEGTQEAVLTAQATAGLPETGVVCPATWGWLLRDPEGDSAVRAEVEAEVGTRLADWLQAAVSPPPGAGAQPGGGPAPGAEAGTGAGDHAAAAAAGPAAAAGASGAASRGAWPVVMEGDGGPAVGAMQRALAATGYHCGEDEPVYWQFGADTGNALRTFQACARLPETGVCDAATWHSLVRSLGVQDSVTSLDELQQHLQALHTDDADEGDLVQGMQQGRVWLVGEQRWEK